MAHPNEDLVRRDSRPSGEATWTHIELHDVLANDEHAVALFTIRGKQLNDNEVLVYHFRDGEVSEVWGQATDVYAVDEFLS